jgi:hypothetical protein
MTKTDDLNAVVAATIKLAGPGSGVEPKIASAIVDVLEAYVEQDQPARWEEPLMALVHEVVKVPRGGHDYADRIAQRIAVSAGIADPFNNPETFRIAAGVREGYALGYAVKPSL